MTLLGAAARAPACFPPPAPGMQSSQRPLAARDTNPKPARRRRLTQRRGGVCCLGRCRPRSTRNGLGRRAGQRSRARRAEGGGCVRPVKDPTAAQTAALRGGGSGRRRRQRRRQRPWLPKNLPVGRIRPRSHSPSAASWLLRPRHQSQSPVTDHADLGGGQPSTASHINVIGCADVMGTVHWSKTPVSACFTPIFLRQSHRDRRAAPRGPALRQPIEPARGGCVPHGPRRNGLRRGWALSPAPLACRQTHRFTRAHTPPPPPPPPPQPRCPAVLARTLACRASRWRERPIFARRRRAASATARAGNGRGSRHTPWGGVGRSFPARFSPHISHAT